MMAYNHERFISQAVEGVLMRITNFDFDIIIGEVNSTDNTRKIIIEYQKKYPGKFKLLLHKSNIGANANQMAILEACTGKYIALCEGDDYWTDPEKLQKQVDFLETHQEFSLSFHKAFREYKGTFIPFTEDYKKEIYELKDLFSGWFIPTASIVFRNIITKYPEWLLHTKNGDLALLMNIGLHGKLKLINEPMSVYRIHENGMSNTFPRAELVSNLIYVYFNVNILCENRYKSDMESGIDSLIIGQYKNEILRREFENGRISRMTSLFSLIDLIKAIAYRIKLRALKSLRQLLRRIDD